MQECFSTFQNIKGRFGHAVDWAGNWKETRDYPVAIEARNRQNPAAFELEKCVVLLRRASIVTRRSLVVQFF